MLNRWTGVLKIFGPVTMGNWSCCAIRWSVRQLADGAPDPTRFITPTKSKQPTKRYDTKCDAKNSNDEHNQINVKFSLFSQFGSSCYSPNVDGRVSRQLVASINRTRYFSKLRIHNGDLEATAWQFVSLFPGVLPGLLAVYRNDVYFIRQVKN